MVLGQHKMIACNKMDDPSYRTYQLLCLVQPYIQDCRTRARVHHLTTWTLHGECRCELSMGGGWSHIRQYLVGKIHFAAWYHAVQENAARRHRQRPYVTMQRRKLKTDDTPILPMT